MPTLVPSLCLTLQIPSTIPSMWALSHIAPPDSNTVLRWHLGFLPQVYIFCYWSAPYKGLERYSWVMVLLCLYKDVFGWGKRNLYLQRNYCLEYISTRRNGVWCLFIWQFSNVVKDLSVCLFCLIETTELDLYTLFSHLHREDAYFPMLLVMIKKD